jgi:hypothetical protein
MKEAKGLIKKHDFVDDRTRDAVCLDMAVFMQDSVHPTLQAVERFVYPGIKRAWPVGKHEDPILQRWTCNVTQNGAQSLKTQHTLKRFWAKCNAGCGTYRVIPLTLPAVPWLPAGQQCQTLR